MSTGMNQVRSKCVDNVSTSRVLQIQQRPRSAPPNHLSGEIKHLSTGLPVPHPSWEVARSTCPTSCKWVVSRVRVLNSTLLQHLCNDPLPLPPLAQLLNCSRLKVHIMMQQVNQVLPSTLLPSWTWSLGQRRTQTQWRKWNRTVSILE